MPEFHPKFATDIKSFIYRKSFISYNLNTLYSIYCANVGKCLLDSLGVPKCWCCTEMEGCMLIRCNLTYALVNWNILIFAGEHPQKNVLFSFKTLHIKGISKRCPNQSSISAIEICLCWLPWLLVERTFKENFLDCGRELFLCKDDTINPILIPKGTFENRLVVVYFYDIRYNSLLESP